MSSLLDWYMYHSPIKNYPVESIVVSITLFCFSLWLMGSKINREIADQVAIPLVKEIKDAGFKQNPGFNTLSHPMRRGYIALPALSNKDPSSNNNNTTTEDYPTTQSLNQYLWPESHNSYHLYATAHDHFRGVHCHITTIPRQDILMQIGALFGILPNQDLVTIKLSFKHLEPFFWSLSRDKQLVSQLKKDWEGKQTKGSDEQVKQESTNTNNKKNVKQKKKADTSATTTTTTTAIPAPSTLSLFADDGDNTPLMDDSAERDYNNLTSDDEDEDNQDDEDDDVQDDSSTKSTIIGNVIDLGGLKLTHALLDQHSEYVFTTDTPQLIHNKKLSPCPDDVIKFLLGLKEETGGAFELQSFSISDQSDSYDVVNLADIPQVSGGAGDDVEVEEESALLTASFSFNFEKVPRVLQGNEDVNNQAYVNQWVTRICAFLFVVGHKMLDYQLPKEIKVANLKMREAFNPGQQLSAEPTPREKKERKLTDKQARDGISNSILGSGNLKKRNVAAPSQ